MIRILRKNAVYILLFLSVAAFICYFAIYTVIRYKHIYASYYDLGIMNQAVFNTYKAITTFDFSRFLEMTDPLGPDQIKRMAIHNDVFLAVLAPFYLIHAGPETLLVIQAIVVGLGGLGIFGIAQHLFGSHKYRDVIALVFSISYLLYPALERATIFEFHAVTLCTAFLIFMYYFWLKKKYIVSFIFIVLALSTKEEVGFVTAFFGLFILLQYISFRKNIYTQLKKMYQLFTKPHTKQDKENAKKMRYAVLVIVLSLIWSLISVFVIIPYFRGSQHFALQNYDDGIASVAHALDVSTIWYLFFLLGPLAFLSLASPLTLFISLPEFAINLFSSNANMRNIIYHYTSVITPWIFISAMYGAIRMIPYVSKRGGWKYIVCIVVITTVLFSFWKGPLPYSKEADTYAFHNKRAEQKHIDLWATTLQDDSIKVAASSQISPIFTSRRYFYQFSKDYNQADYVVIRLPEVYNYPEKDVLIPIYERLLADPEFVKIFDQDSVVVYKKL